MTDENDAPATSPSAPVEAPAASGNAAPAPRPRRLWPGYLLIAIYWAVQFGAGQFDLPITTSFFTTVIVGAVVVLFFTIWWLTNGTIRGRDRLAVFAALVLGGVAAALVSKKTLSVGGVLFFGLPLTFTVWIVWAAIARRRSSAVFRWGAIAAILLTWTYVSLLRMDGLSGDLKADVHWRWEPTIEDKYLAERAKQADTSPSLSEAAGEVVAGEGDWTAFRGPLRNGEVRGLEIASDWKKTPPEQVWRQRIGPAWSSMLIVGGRLFTQEQVGEDEAVLCLDAKTGERIWTHNDKARWWDSQSGAGPRGTPGFADGALYTQGGTGILNCLDAGTGEVKWSREITKDAEAAVPIWGFSSSPLIVDDMVVTFAGGKNNHGLVAYNMADGTPAWHAPTGPISYSSGQPIALEDGTQIVFMSDGGLIAVEPSSGKILWNFDAPGNGVWRATQPAALGTDQILFGSEDLGTVCLEVRRDGDEWQAKKLWSSKSLKPAYNDFVLYDGTAYGFDGGIFAAMDAASGKRRWKGGRYGHGQVLLLADQGLLLVTAETGEVALVSASPDKLHEVARFQAIEGKTWNHAAIAHGCLYLRNDQEIACYRLPAVTSPQ